MGREIAKIIAELSEDIDDNLDSTQIYQREQYEARLEERREALEILATTQTATSLEGAMLQIMIARGEADSIFSHVPEENKASMAICEGQLRRIEYSLLSALTVLSNASGTSLSEVGGRYFINTDELERIDRRTGPDPAMIAHMAVRKAETGFNAFNHEHPDNEESLEFQAVSDLLGETYRNFANMAPTTPHGACAKLRFVLGSMGDGDDMDACHLKSLLTYLEGMSHGH
jgi:hypothetical protein